MKLVKFLICLTIFSNSFQANAQDLAKIKPESTLFLNFNMVDVFSIDMQSDFGDKTKLLKNDFKSPNINLDFLKEYEFKTYNMSEYYVFHRLEITPHYIKNQFPLPPYVERQKIEIIKKKK
jgi:hypothetical protein